MVMHSIRNVIKPRKQPNLANNPHKRDPDVHFARIWVSKKQCEVIHMIAKARNATAQSTVTNLISYSKCGPALC